MRWNLAKMFDLPYIVALLARIMGNPQFYMPWRDYLDLDNESTAYFAVFPTWDWVDFSEIHENLKKIHGFHGRHEIDRNLLKPMEFLWIQMWNCLCVHCSNQWIPRGRWECEKFWHFSLKCMNSGENTGIPHHLGGFHGFQLLYPTMQVSLIWTTNTKAILEYILVEFM